MSILRILMVILMSLFVVSCSDRQTSGSSPEPSSVNPVEQSASASTAEPQTDSTASILSEIPEEFQMTVLKPWTGDFGEMAKRRVVRALVVYSKTLYFMDMAEQKGISYEALKGFEDFINTKLNTGNLRIHVAFIPVSRDQLMPGLLNGQGDIAAANLTITPERLVEVDFSEAAHPDVSELIVTGPGAPPLAAIEDLAGREVYVRRSSSYYSSLQTVNETFRKANRSEIKIIPVDEHLETEDILEMTNAGLYPITVADSHMAVFWSQIYDNIRVHSDLAVRSGGSIGWAFRKNSPELKKIVDEFIRGHRKGTLLGNVVLKKYLRKTDWVRNNSSESERKKFTEMVEFFRKYSQQYDFDYLMMMAQGYQESQLDQGKKSRAGAVGVMQLLPSTAADRNVNIPNVDASAENNIHAGVKYMRFMLDHYFQDEPMDELNMHLFAFASYNAGPGRISGLRRKASAIGLNPNIWFNHVEVLASREIGRETVQYVSNIFKYYLAYKQIAQSMEERESARSVSEN